MPRPGPPSERLRQAARRVRVEEGGITIVEVMAAAVVLVVGILGVLMLLDTANATTADNLAREQATTLARDVVERAHQLPYDSIVATTAPAAFRQALSDGPSTANADGSWTMTRRGTTYTVSVRTCSVDDTSDGNGVTDGSYCPATGGTGSGGTGGGGGGSAIGVNLLGFAVTVGGSVATAVCDLLGNPTAAGALLGSGGALIPTQALLNAGVSVSVCAGQGQIAIDETPDDLSRAGATVTWTSSGETRSVVQTTVVPNPGT